jgi:hypothetical protein
MDFLKIFIELEFLFFGIHNLEYKLQHLTLQNNLYKIIKINVTFIIFLKIKIKMKNYLFTNMDIQEFSFVTFNIDSRPFNREERLNAFIEKIKSEPPDVVVIQEASRVIYEKLFREFKLLGYKRQLRGEVDEREDVEIMFSKFPIIEGGYIPFRKTLEKRGISFFRIEVFGNKNFIIATSQFDSQVSHSRNQTVTLDNHLKNILSPSDNLIFGGDTKISEYQKDLSQNPPEGYIDSWYESGKDEEKYTYDSTVNFLVPKPYKDRPDRVWYKPSSKGYRVTCTESKLYGRDFHVAISSHYGVWVKFQIE